MKEKVSNEVVTHQRVRQFANALMRVRDVDMMIALRDDTTNILPCWAPPDRQAEPEETLIVDETMLAGTKKAASALYNSLKPIEPEIADELLATHRETLAIQRMLYEREKTEE